MLVIFVIFAVFFDDAASQIGGCKRVVCYLTNWGQYRPKPMTFFPEDTDTTFCTHLIYAFATLKGNKLAPYEWNDEDSSWSKGLYTRFNSLKAKNPKLKTLLAVGGWNMESAPFSQMVSTDQNMQLFVKTSVEFLRNRGFDGLDLDWEYPTLRGGKPEDRGRFTKLVKELAKAFREEALRADRNKLLLTVAVGAGKKTIDAAYDADEIGSDADFINLMSYDFHGAWDTEVGHNSPLYSNDTLSVSFAAEYFLSLGIPKHKLVIGLPFYGRHVYLEDPTDHMIGSKVEKAGDAGQFTREPGILAYYEICKLIKTGGETVLDLHLGVPYYYKDRLWIGYDDAASLSEKVKYINREQLGGVMIWTLDFDDFNGSQCGNGRYPLLRTINRECKKPQPAG